MDSYQHISITVGKDTPHFADRCTELPGEVVRSIGACYTYIAEEQPVPVGLNERILQATLGTVVPHEVRHRGHLAQLQHSRLARSHCFSPTRYRGDNATGSDFGINQHCFGRWIDQRCVQSKFAIS